MKIDIKDFNDYIKEKDLKQITSPLYFQAGTIPDENGLFSTEIFGRPGSKDRKTNWAYIDLHGKFLHPVYFNLFTSMNKKIEALVLSKKYFVVKNGELVEDDENGETGPSFFYRIYKELKFNDTGTNSRNTSLSLLDKTNENEMFIDKWLVIPPLTYIAA